MSKKVEKEDEIVIKVIGKNTKKSVRDFLEASTKSDPRELEQKFASNCQDYSNYLNRGKTKKKTS
jgi:hypothetical protein